MGSTEEIKYIFLDSQKEILFLLKQIYPSISEEILLHRIQEIFSYENYICWGYFKNNELLGICGGWITERFYCGKQLEIDNFIVEENHRSGQIGEKLLKHIEDFARQKDFFTIELNSYVHAGRSHKFYFRNGYTVLGFHFEKKLKTL